MDLVPTVNNVDFYSNASAQESRYKNLNAQFTKRFNASPQFFARAPGRVNLIGEHIDYCNFSVLPMAIEVDVVAAVSASSNSTVTIANTDPKFQEMLFDFPLDGSVVTINLEKQTWGNYFKCAAIVAHNFILEKYPEVLDHGHKPLQGLKAIFDGNVPTGGGLSSSAAFCIAATLAVLRVNGISEISKADLTRITVVSEHYVGLNNGGMDQCASVNGEPSKVLLIQFKPTLKATPFKLPETEPESVFLITNSLITANKTETAPTNYNLRVVEVAVAAEVIAAKFGLQVPKDSNLDTATLRGSLDAYFSQVEGEPLWDGQDIEVGIRNLTRMIEVVKKLYSEEEKDGITSEQAAAYLGITEKEFSEVFLTKFPVRYQKLNLYKRSIHVYSDALRVLQVIQLARNFDGNSEKYLQALGKLMNESQVSTRDYNNASAPGCDDICKIAGKNGAYGSRVTGAGFGGSIVHLTTVERLPQLVNALRSEYYQTHFPGITADTLSAAIVVSKPAQGACVVEI
ncbi:CIC11C00000000287 [Sungouiella intermedia]|uniref:Galactokinase n=1 Tax=Sungouiella intermedia TaxID=45354 RepID=A0A1L0DB20_9ASCO|nr:CIC11C00000000287 [[Candida] intermedia]